VTPADIGVAGLGVMGRSLARNIARHGYSVAVHNRTSKHTKRFVERYGGAGRIEATYSEAELVAALLRPRRVLMMVTAGQPTEQLVDRLLPCLDRGDVLVDGGNARDRDTEERIARVASKGVFYLGVGISGGEEGALSGPSIMAGGPREGYAIVGPILEAIAARGPERTCCALLGSGAAGHYVKTVHNGIEYALMQVLAEAYDIMRRGFGMSAIAIADVFAAWDRGELASYLVGITAEILRRVDRDSGEPLLEKILDTADQKGTGNWSSQSALELGTPCPVVAAAVFARILSSLKQERVTAQRLLVGPPEEIRIDRDAGIRDLRSAVLLGSICAYAQGMRQLLDASQERGYGLDLAEVARVWMAGCIIRSRLLVPIAEAFHEQPRLPLLLVADRFASLWSDHHEGLRRTLTTAQRAGIPVPVLGASLAAIDAYRSGRLPANLIQAQRDRFGAHTYRRVDREGAFHTLWDASGAEPQGEVTSG